MPAAEGHGAIGTGGMAEVRVVIESNRLWMASASRAMHAHHTINPAPHHKCKLCNCHTSFNIIASFALNYH